MAETSKTAIVALVVATLSMLATVGNVAFTLWRYKAGQAANLVIQCRARDDATFTLLDSPPFFRTMKVGLQGRGGERPPDIDFRNYDTSISLVMECRFTNNTEKAVAIEDFHTALEFRYSDQAWFAAMNLSPLIGVLDRDRRPARLPVLVNPSEQVVYHVVVGWPLENKARHAFEQACPKVARSGEFLGAFRECLVVHRLGLGDDLSWPGRRRLRVIAGEAGGNRFHESVAYDLSESFFVGGRAGVSRGPRDE